VEVLDRACASAHDAQIKISLAIGRGRTVCCTRSCRRDESRQHDANVASPLDRIQRCCTVFSTVDFSTHNVQPKLPVWLMPCASARNALLRCRFSSASCAHRYPSAGDTTGRRILLCQHGLAGAESGNTISHGGYDAQLRMDARSLSSASTADINHRGDRRACIRGRQSCNSRGSARIVQDALYSRVQRYRPVIVATSQEFYRRSSADSFRWRGRPLRCVAVSTLSRASRNARSTRAHPRQRVLNT